MAPAADTDSTGSASGRARVRTYATASRAARFVFGSARRELLVALGAEVASALALAGVLVFGRRVVLDLTAEVRPDGIADMILPVLGLAASLLVSGLATVVIREYRALVSELVTRSTQDEIIGIATAVDFEQFEQQDFHDLLERANTRAAQSSYQMVFDMLTLSNVVVTSIAVLLVLVGTVPQILGALVLITIPFALAARASARLAFQATYELTTNDRLRFYLYDALTAKRDAREVRVFALGPSLHDRWNRLYDGRITRMRELLVRRVLINGLAAAAAAALIGGVLIVLVRAALNDDITLADAAVAIVALQQLSARIRAGSSSAGSLRQSALFLDEFDRFQKLHSHRPADTAAVEPVPASSLNIAGVSFVYPGTDRAVLDDVSLDIAPGEIVALVGESGSGKTTLAHLVAGLYQPSEGSISYGGQDIRDIGRQRWWRSVTAVFQDFSRYELTARENVAMSDRDRADDLDAVRDAARRADIADELEALSAGYDTMLSRSYEGGVDLSVGQWQRVAVARAFFRDSPLLILDEPAAALDARAEQVLHERVEELCQNRSALIISHRFSTVRLADRICVMSHGRIVEAGTHSELMDLGGQYAELFNLQARGYSMGSGPTGT